MQISFVTFVVVTFASQRKAITAIVKKAYQFYFGCKIGDQTNPGPHMYVAVNVQQIFRIG
jgi:hypothetical protein